MSHGTHDEKAIDIERARAAANKMGRPLAVLVDLSGPKIRTGELKDDQPVQLEAGSLFTITTRRVSGDEHQVSTNYPDLPRLVHPAPPFLLPDRPLPLPLKTIPD